MSITDHIVQEESSSDTQSFCPNCHAKLNNFDKFCGFCGRRLNGSSSTPGQSSSTSGSLETDYSLVSRPRSSMVAQFELQGSPVLGLLSHYTNPSRTVRELYFDLGNKLFHLHEFAKAAEAFQQASLTSAEQPPTVDILFYLALAYEKDQKNDRAFRVYLEAVLQAPQYPDAVLLHLHAFLTPDIVSTHSTWVITELQKHDESITGPLNRAHIALLVGHMQLFLADYRGAQEQFERAAQLAPDVVPGLVGEILAADRLPSALAQSSTESSTHLILARLLNALHSYNLALQEANLAIQLARADSDPWVQAQQVRVRILKAMGESAEAAAVYYKLGISLYSRDKLTDALNMFSLSIELRKDHALAYWYQADVYQMLAGRTQNLEEQQRYTLKGLECWEAGFEQQHPGVEDAWVYLTKAYLCEKRASLPKTLPSRYWWEAIACLEQAILLGRQDSYVWASLGRYHRFLTIETNALEETQRAMDAADKDNDARTYAMYERVPILANVGRHKDAKPLILELLDKDKSSWVKIVYAIIAFYLHYVNDAIDTLDGVLKDDEKNLWAYNFRAFCYRVIGKTELANADYDTILDIYHRDNTENIGDREYYACAEYMRGNPKEATAVYEDLLKDPAENVHFGLGLCYLKLGQRESGVHYLVEGIRRATNNQQLDDLVFDLDDFANFTQTLPTDEQEQAQQAIEQARNKIKQQRKKLERTAEDELRQVFKHYSYRNTAGTWAWIATRASLARLYREQQRWLEAVEMYRLLLKEGDRFYEAAIGLQKTADELFVAGDQAQREGDFARALGLYRKAQSFIPELLAHDAPRTGGLYTRLGFAQFSLADRENARRSFVEAVAAYRTGDIAAPGKAMSDLCKTLLRDPGQYWELRDWWSKWQSDPSLAEEARNDLSSVTSFLDTYLDEFLKCKTQNEQPFKSVLPIVLELGTALVPTGDSSEWPLFKTYLPEMRQRIKQDTSIEALYVQIRDNQDLRENEYQILLDEIPVAKFQVAIGGRFSPASREALEAIGVPHDALIDAATPQTGKMGCWIAPHYHQHVLDQGKELWEEPLVYVVHHLDYVLHSNLACFLDTQEAENMLQQWIAAKHASWVDTVLDSADIRLYFMRVLRALAREQVPLHHWEAILQTILEPDLASADGNTVLSRVRLRLKQWLPGNPRSSRAVQCVALSADLDRALMDGLQIVQERNDLVLYTSALQALITFIQESFATKGWNLVLIIHTARLRFLLETLAPSLMILTHEEYMTSTEGAENE